MTVKEILSQRLELLIEKKKDENHKNTVPQQAKSMGIPYPTLAKYINGDAECSATKLIKIAKYYGVSTDYLLGISPNPTTNKDLDAVCKYVGLSVEAVQKLKQIALKNHATANSDTLSLFIEDDNFEYLLALISGKMSIEDKEETPFTVGNARMEFRTSDITDYSITQTTTDITNRMKNKYTARFSTVDERQDYLMKQKLFQFADSLLQEGRISVDEYNKIIEEYRKGNFDYELNRKV